MALRSTKARSSNGVFKHGVASTYGIAAEGLDLEMESLTLVPDNMPLFSSL